MRVLSAVALALIVGSGINSAQASLIEAHRPLVCMASVADNSAAFSHFDLKTPRLHQGQSTMAAPLFALPN